MPLISFTVALFFAVSVFGQPKNVPTALPPKVTPTKHVPRVEEMESARAEVDSDDFLPRSVQGQDLWQPPARRWVLSPFLSYGTFKSKAKGETATGSFETESEMKPKTLGLTLSYGITDETSLGLTLRYTQSLVKVPSDEYTFEGFNDFTFHLKQLSVLDPIVLHYGFDVGFSGADGDFDSAEKKGNQFSGGWSARPYVAIQSLGELFLVGGGVSYLRRGDKTTKLNGSDLTATGGHQLELSFFGELPMQGFQPGLKLSYLYTDKTKYQPTGFIRETESEPVNAWAAKFYTHVPIENLFEILPSIEYTSSLQKDGAGIESPASGLSGQLLFRLFM